jgi:hypothetical protein
MRQSWRSTSTSGVSVSQRRLHSSSSRGEERVNDLGGVERTRIQDKQYSICKIQLSRSHVGREENIRARAKLYPDLSLVHTRQAQTRFWTSPG